MKTKNKILQGLVSILLIFVLFEVANSQNSNTIHSSMRVSVNIVEPAKIEVIDELKADFLTADYSESDVIANDLTIGFVGLKESVLSITIIAPEYLVSPCGAQALFHPNIYHIKEGYGFKINSGQRVNLTFEDVNCGRFRSIEKINVNGTVNAEDLIGQMTGTYIVQAEYN